MRKFLFTVLTVLLCASSAHAYTTMLHKLSSGIKDVIIGPFSIFTVPSEQIKRENDRALAIAGGLMEGAAQSAFKPVQGVFKILTFPFVNHEFDE